MTIQEQAKQFCENKQVVRLEYHSKKNSLIKNSQIGRITGAHKTLIVFQLEERELVVYYDQITNIIQIT